jgi:16S rRNA (cytosine1402-N4)-methyltransferase
MTRFGHVPVLLEESLEFLDIRSEGVYIDATLGAAGHTEAILRRATRGKVLGIDRDAAALAVARERLKDFGERVIIVQGNFAQLEELHRASGLTPADGLLADLGMSSLQLEDASRGFSFRAEGVLDMRMDTGSGPTAADLVNGMSENELADLLWRYGEERQARRLARAILGGRPYQDTRQLALSVKRVIPSRTAPQQFDSLRRVWQALRIGVNREMECLESMLSQALGVLKPGGRVVILAYHSLEDRRVKYAFRAWQAAGRAEILTRKVVRPGPDELRANPRSHSAKLRAARKVDE